MSQFEGFSLLNKHSNIDISLLPKVNGNVNGNLLAASTVKSTTIVNLESFIESKNIKGNVIGKVEPRSNPGVIVTDTPKITPSSSKSSSV